MPNFKTRHLLIALIPLAIAGCVSPEDQRAMDQDKCASYGYQPGTNRFADCMMEQDWQRRDDERRWKEDVERDNRRFEKQAEANWRETQDRLNRQRDSNVDTIDTTPQFDKDGNPNFDTEGNYIGCRGIGCEVDNPDVDDD